MTNAQAALATAAQIYEGSRLDPNKTDYYAFKRLRDELLEWLESKTLTEPPNLIK